MLETVHQIITNLTFIKETDGLPVRICFDETSQFSEGLANISVTHSSAVLQKLPKIGKPCDITFLWVEVTGQKPHVK